MYALTVPANATQGGWISVRVPQQVKAGKYTGTVTVKDGDKVLSELKLAVNVKNRTLPASTEWAFHLDLWQNPYAEARYYNVELNRFRASMHRVYPCGLWHKRP